MEILWYKNKSKFLCSYFWNCVNIVLQILANFLLIHVKTIHTILFVYSPIDIKYIVCIKIWKWNFFYRNLILCDILYHFQIINEKFNTRFRFFSFGKKQKKIAKVHVKLNIGDINIYPVLYTLTLYFVIFW